jgi:excisionase family DNA binding protein
LRHRSTLILEYDERKSGMKIDIDHTVLIDTTVEKVFEQPKPLLNNAHDSRDTELKDEKGQAEYRKVKETWVYEKIHTKKIPFQKAGRFPRFRKKHIDKWLDNPYSFLHVPIGRSKRKEAIYNE